MFTSWEEGRQPAGTAICYIWYPWISIWPGSGGPGSAQPGTLSLTLWSPDWGLFLLQHSIMHSLLKSPGYNSTNFSLFFPGLSGDFLLWSAVLRASLSFQGSLNSGLQARAPCQTVVWGSEFLWRWGFLCAMPAYGFLTFWNTGIGFYHGPTTFTPLNSPTWLISLSSVISSVCYWLLFSNSNNNSSNESWHLSASQVATIIVCIISVNLHRENEVQRDYEAFPRLKS